MYGSRLSDCGLFRLAMVKGFKKETLIELKFCDSDLTLVAWVYPDGAVFFKESLGFGVQVGKMIAPDQLRIYTKFVYNVNQISQKFEEYLSTLKV